MRLIAGSGRSGTTWVLDALATANGLRPVFEPLHPYVSNVGDRFAHRALAPDDVEPELERFLEMVCAGRSHVLWTKYRRQMRWLFPPPAEFSTKRDAGRVSRQWGRFFRDMPRLALAGRRREWLVKCIRANLMLGWLSRQLKCRTVLIVRHPGAVIESELRGGWNARFALERFRTDAKLDQMTEGRYRQLLNRQLSTIEALTVRWIVENDWVIQSAEANGVTVVFYERLRNSPEREWQRICRALELATMPSAELISRPSQQSSPRTTGSFKPIFDRPRWMRFLAPEQIAQVQAVLDAAQFNLYSMSDAEPRTSVAEAGGSKGLRITR
jgi:hypothetical protein